MYNGFPQALALGMFLNSGSSTKADKYVSAVL